jgi:hypothetical protein
MRRAVLILACLTGAAFAAGAVAAVTVGCGTPAVDSPEHLGSWAGTIGGAVTVTVEVGGTPGHYTAQYGGQAIGYGEEGSLSLAFSDGKADAKGNIAFDKSDARYPATLTLGPVSGGRMRSTLTMELSPAVAEQAGQKTQSETCDLSRQ